MARLFISHSSTDKVFVRMLSRDLQAHGHTCWLDEWEIKVGESITAKIEQGLDDSDHVLLILSQKATESRWVEREWRSKFWQQIDTGRTLILPCLIEECQIPSLLGDVRYANFVNGYSNGFGELLASIHPAKPSPNPIEETRKAQSLVIATLIASAQKRENPLSTVMGDTLTMAHTFGLTDLEQFCKEELVESTPPQDESSGEDQRRPWRVLNGYAANNYSINPNYVGFNHSPNAMYSYIENDSSFTPIKLFWSASVAQIEAAVETGTPPNAMCMTLQQPIQTEGGKTRKVTLYFRTNSMQMLLLAIRSELSKRLIAQLPSPSAT